MINGYIEKTSTETKYFDADFSAEIPSGDTIRAVGAGSTTKATAMDSAGSDKTGLVIGSVAVSTTKVRFRIQNGTDGMNYLVSVTAEMTTAGTVFQKFYEVRVRDKRRTS